MGMKENGLMFVIQGVSAKDAASHVHHASHGGQERHSQANADLNRE